jgi:hypothetical protein
VAVGRAVTWAAAGGPGSGAVDHLLGRSMKVEVNPGTADAHTILDVPSEIRRVGDGTSDEMCTGILIATPAT